MIVGAVAVLALVGMLGFVIGRARDRQADRERRPESLQALPGSTTVRRSTGPGLITLRPSDGVDLDDLTTPTWNAGTGCVTTTSDSPPTRVGCPSTTATLS